MTSFLKKQVLQFKLQPWYCAINVPNEITFIYLQGKYYESHKYFLCCPRKYKLILIDYRSLEQNLADCVKAITYIFAQLHAYSMKLTKSQLQLTITTTDDLSSSLIAALLTAD